MLRTASDFGIPPQEWDRAKYEARNVMIARAKLRGMIPYSDLVAQISAARFEAYDTRLFNLLGQISVEEDAAGHGMLSVVVVHKHGDMQPGPGFFELAKHLGRDTKDLLRFWSDELKKVHAFWSVKAKL